MPGNDTVLDLIAMTQYPSMPAPWISKDNASSESWIWGDFFILFQIQPVTIEEMVTVAAGEKYGKRNLVYLSAALVFYRNQKSPHGPSSRPVFAACVEQADFGAAAAFMKQQGMQVPAGVPTEGLGPIMLGSFSADARTNRGQYRGSTDIAAMRSTLFDLIEDNVPVTGDPEKIGSLEDAKGHPLTGVPENDKAPTGHANKGCLLALASLLATSAVPPAVYYLT